MWGPEQFIYYLVLLKWLVKSCVAAGIKVKDIYVDFACRLAKTWERYLDKKGDSQFQTEAERECARGFRLLTNWMHGSSHEMSCQLQNNGRCADGAGHRDGEGSERLWADTKVRISLNMVVQHKFIHIHVFIRIPANSKDISATVIAEIILRRPYHSLLMISCPQS